MRSRAPTHLPSPVKRELGVQVGAVSSAVCAPAPRFGQEFEGKLIAQPTRACVVHLDDGRRLRFALMRGRWYHLPSRGVF